MNAREIGKFLRAVENRLGWAPVNDFARKATVKKVTEKVEAEPDRWTLHDLLLAVELLAREQQARSPLGVFAHVERAQGLAREKETDVEELIREAIRIESHRGDPDGWVVRFARATGSWWRTEAYEEWRAAQRRARR